MKSVPTNVHESSRWRCRAQFVASRHPLIRCTGQYSNDEQTADPGENALTPTQHVEPLPPMQPSIDRCPDLTPGRACVAHTLPCSEAASARAKAQLRY